MSLAWLTRFSVTLQGIMYDHHNLIKDLSTYLSLNMQTVMFSGTMRSLKLWKSTDTWLGQDTKAAGLSITGPKPNAI